MNIRKLLSALILITVGLIWLNSCTKSADGTVTVIPIAPTALKATTFSTTVINLTWTDNSTTEDGFKIERKNGAADFSLIATLGADKTAYKDSLLAPYTTYTYRVYSYNSAGKSITYTNLDSATTSGVPLLTTRAIDSLSYKTAKSGGIISNSGGALVTAKGVVWSTSNIPSIDLATKTNDGVDTGNYKSSMTGLTPGTLYYVWAYATNSKGTAFGNMAEFKTLALALPIIATTSAASLISATTAQSGGNVTSDGGSAITARGVCWATTANPTTANSKTTDGTGIGAFTSSLTGLTAITIYYVRSYATNSVGTVYGTQVSFTTTASSTATLPSVTIGTQIWANKNLDVSSYRNGDIIPQVTDQAAWAGLTTGAWCYYANTTSNGTTYGKLYNWYAVSDSRGLAPTGYHIPTDAEWTTLTTFLGGPNGAAGKMKERGEQNTGTGPWTYPNTGATNSSGFSGLPAGMRSANGFTGINSQSYWWSSTQGGNGTIAAWHRCFLYNSENVQIGSGNMENGLSIRCVKD